MRTADVRLSFPDSEAALLARAAIEPDNDGFVTVRIDGSDLVLHFVADSTMGLLRSIDDVLGCLRSIEQET